MKQIDLEPADRDPRAIRRTVWILIILMIGGGSMIVWKYLEKQKGDRVETEAGRAPRIGRLTNNFKGIAQDGKGRGLFELEGKVWVVAAIVPSQPEENEVVLEVMKDLAKRYADEPNFHLVCLSVEDPEKVGYEKLAKLAERVGADVDRWWFLTAGQDKMRGYVKDVLKLSLVDEKAGKIDIAAKVRVIDQSRRLRGDYEQFDFDFAREKEEEALADLVNHPELADTPEAKYYLNLSQLFKDRMFKVIDYTLVEKEGDEDPNYSTAVLVVLGIILFIVVQGIRLRGRARG